MQLIIYLKDGTVKSPIFKDDLNNRKLLSEIQVKTLSVARHFRKCIVIELNDWSVAVRVNQLVALEVR